MSTTDDEKPSIFCIKIWLLKTLFASIFMGLGLFLYAVNFSHKGLMAQAYIGPIPLLWHITVKVIYAIRNKIKIGQFINYEKSNFFTPDKKFRKENMIPLFGSIYANVAHRFLFALAFKYAMLGGLN